MTYLFGNESSNTRVSVAINWRMYSYQNCQKLMYRIRVIGVMLLSLCLSWRYSLYSLPRWISIIDIIYVSVYYLWTFFVTSIATGIITPCCRHRLLHNVLRDFSSIQIYQILSKIKNAENVKSKIKTYWKNEDGTSVQMVQISLNLAWMISSHTVRRRDISDITADWRRLKF